MGTFKSRRYHPRSHHEVLYPVPDVEPSTGAPPADPEPAPTAEQRAARMMMTSGSSFELFSGLIGLAVAIVGLTGYYPTTMAAIATIAVGFALLAQGMTIAARWQEAMKIEGREHVDVLGITTEMFGGLAGIALGVIALMGVIPETVLAAAVIVLGVALLLGGPAQPDLAENLPASRTRWHVTRDIVRASSGVMVMGGLAALVLGVIAATSLGPVVPLALASLLCVAAALMLAGGSLFARFSRRFA